jgi:uncharacterized protein YehS (DUF1456 family)
LIRTLQLHGLQVTDEAIEFLLKKSEQEGDSTLLDRVLASLDLQQLRHGYLEKRTVEHACAAVRSSLLSHSLFPLFSSLLLKRRRKMIFFLSLSVFFPFWRSFSSFFVTLFCASAVS